MDIATFLGLIGGIAVIIAAITTSSELHVFLNPPGMMIVLGGTAAATLIKFPLSHCFSALKVAVRAFRTGVDSPTDLIRTAHRLSDAARKRGMLALEDEEIENEFLRKGVQLAVDGQPPEFVQRVLKEDMQLSAERHHTGQDIFRAIGESAPAFGMIGTLVGLVQMLANMQDPDSIGPAMAVALLTTLYGALIANLVALPIADKLELRGMQERLNEKLIIDIMAAVQSGQNPRLMDEILETYLPHADREVIMAGLASPPTETEGG